jgi:hypothetical protein
MRALYNRDRLFFKDTGINQSPNKPTCPFLAPLKIRVRTKPDCVVGRFRDSSRPAIRKWDRRRNAFDSIGWVGLVAAVVGFPVVDEIEGRNLAEFQEMGTFAGESLGGTGIDAGLDFKNEARDPWVPVNLDDFADLSVVVEVWDENGVMRAKRLVALVAQV